MIIFEGLGAFSVGQDFSCTQISRSIYRCKATGDNWAATLASFKGLQTTVKEIAQRMREAGAVSVPSQITALVVDGQPGNTTALGVQFIGTALAAVVPPKDPAVVAALTPTGDAKTDIQQIAAYAAEIDDYFKYVISAHPEALNPPPEVIEKIKNVEKIVLKEYGFRFRPVGTAVIVAGILGVLGLAAAGVYYARRQADPYEYYGEN